jgi:hypothetical protein
MRHALFAILLAAAATPAVAGDFVVDGTHITYTASRDARGDVLLNGRAGFDPFALRVHGNRVDGTMGLSSVSFQVSPATIARLDNEVPSQARQAAVTPATFAAN